MSQHLGFHKHHKGGTYTSLMIVKNATNGADYEEMVIYVSHTTGMVFCRSLKEWTELVEWPRTEMGDRLLSDTPLFIREGTKHPRFMRWPEPEHKG